MNCAVIPPVLKNKASKLSQVLFYIPKTREIYHNIDFSENVSSGIRCIFWSIVIFNYHIYSSEILTTSKS